MTRLMLSLVVVVVFSFTTTSRAVELPAGITSEQPAEGPYVKLPDGNFMVPYTMAIPGTEVKYTMVPIPGGEFVMGSPADEEGRRDDEGPQVKVKVAPFWMGQTEITWEQYKVYMDLYFIFKDFEINGVRSVTDDNKADAVTAPTELYDPSFTYEYGDDPKMPAVTMTQYAAKQYTKWLSAITKHQYRLPTEAEWEYACRGGATTAYHFGDDPAKLGEYAWYYENSDDGLQKVAQKKPNQFGLYDMHGNVWEWVLDAYDENGYARIAEMQDRKAGEIIAWPTKEFPRVVRGGSWDSEPEECRCASKLASHDVDWKSEDPNIPLSPWWFTSDPARAVGFRLMRPLVALPKEKMVKFWEADVEDITWAIDNRLQEGRGVLGLVDEELPEAIKKMKEE